MFEVLDGLIDPLELKGTARAPFGGQKAYLAYREFPFLKNCKKFLADDACCAYDGDIVLFLFHLRPRMSNSSGQEPEGYYRMPLKIRNFFRGRGRAEMESAAYIKNM